MRPKNKRVVHLAINEQGVMKPACGAYIYASNADFLTSKLRRITCQECLRLWNRS